MYRLATVFCALILGGCANASLKLPVGAPIIVEDENGRVVRHCQVVIVDGEAKTECVNMLSMMDWN